MAPPLSLATETVSVPQQAVTDDRRSPTSQPRQPPHSPNDASQPSPSFDPEKHEQPSALSSSSSNTDHGSEDDDDGRPRRNLSRAVSRARSGRSSLSRTVSEVRDGIQNQRDLELGHSGDEHGKDAELEKDSHNGNAQDASAAADPDLVQWEGKDDPQNPKNWVLRRKWAAVLTVSFFTLISPVASSMVAPALEDIGRDLKIHSSFEEALVLSIFVAAYALGPLIWGPLSELYGRAPILQVSNLWFLLFNLGCGLARTEAQMIAFRFLGGIGGSAPLAVGGGVLSDLFYPEQRGRAISVYSLMPLLGPAIGPIAGGWIAERTSWRWVFYSTTIACGIIQTAGVFLLQETYAPTLLARKKARLIRETDNSNLHTEYDRPDRGLAKTLANALARPFRLLFTQPIVQIMALYMMFLYGMIYLVLSSFPRLWAREYHESVGIASLNYISLGVGFFIGTQLCAPLQDRIYAALKRRFAPPGQEMGPGRPEFRVPMMVPAAVFIPAGLLIYAWTAERHTHWIGPNIGAAIYACGTIIAFQCLQGYAVDAYPRYAASAVGAMTVLRSLAGFGFPLFAPSMYDRLGYGWGGTLLAALAIAIGWPGPFLLWRYGEMLRARSQFSS